MGLRKIPKIRGIRKNLKSVGITEFFKKCEIKKMLNINEIKED